MNDVKHTQPQQLTTVEQLRALDHEAIAYPLRLADIPEDFVCPHKWGFEFGQCLWCGQPGAGEVIVREFDAPTLELIRAVGVRNGER